MGRLMEAEGSGMREAWRLEPEEGFGGAKFSVWTGLGEMGEGRYGMRELEEEGEEKCGMREFWGGGACNKKGIMGRKEGGLVEESFGTDG